MIYGHPNKSKKTGSITTMSRWPNAFFMMATCCIMVGTSWGLYMSVTHDFATSPAHAHLNLLGFVSLCMDISSEMIHALLPVFMITSLGASAST